MHDSNPSLPELPLSKFRNLCDLATEFHQLAPWKWLSDSDMLAIVDPVTQKLRLVSVMGNEGHAFGLLVHRGNRGLRWAFTLVFDQESEDFQDPNFALNQDGLIFEFVPSNELDQREIGWFKQIDFEPVKEPKNHGKVWPKFRSIRPGIRPAPLTEAEAESLLADTRKAINYARLVEPDPSILRREGRMVAFYPTDPNHTGPLKKDDIEWRELTMGPVTLPEPLKLSAEEVKELMLLPQDDNLSLELDCLYSPGVVAAAGDPYPYYPWLSLCVDGGTGAILDTLLTDSRIEGPESVAARCLVSTIRGLRVRPGEVGVSRTGIGYGITSVCDALEILRFKASLLPKMEVAYAGLQGHWKKVEGREES